MSGLVTAAKVGGLVAGLFLVTRAMSPAPRRRKKKPAVVEPAGDEPWDLDTVADLGELASFGPIADPPVHLEPGGRFWLRIDEAKLGTLSATPTVGSVGDDGRPRPPCINVGAEERRGTVRYVPIVASASSEYCTVWVQYDSTTGGEQLGFRVRIDPPLEVGRRGAPTAGERGNHLVLRPGQRKLLDCGGHVLGHVTVVLPAGEYMSRAHSRNGASAVLVDLDERPAAQETVATWLILTGGELVFEHEDMATGQVHVAGVRATDPRCRYGRL